MGPTPWVKQQPTFRRFQGRAAVADLHELPGLARRLEQLGGFPEVNDVGNHDVEILAVDPGAHHIVPADPPREKRHAFVLRRAPLIVCTPILRKSRVSISCGSTR